MGEAVVQTGVSIGCGTIVSAGAVVDHNATVDEYSHINAVTIIGFRSIAKND